MQLIKLYFDDWDGSRDELILITTEKEEVIKEHLIQYKSKLNNYTMEEFLEYANQKGLQFEVPKMIDIEF